MSDTSAGGLFALCGSFIGLSTICVALRIWARKDSWPSLGMDCWIALFGVVTYIGACGCGIELAVLKSNGYGRPTLTAAQVAARARPTIDISLAYDFLIMNTLACAKLSALFFYRHIFNAARNRLLDAVILTTIVVVVAWYITFDVLSCVQCRSHFSAFWDGDFKKYCDLNPIWAKGLAISDLVLDLWVLLLPVPLIWRLHLSIAKKLSIVAVFLLAFVGIGASVARIFIFVTAKAPGAATLYVGLLEAGMTITVVNMPSIWYVCVSTIPELVRRHLNSWSRIYSRSFGRSQRASDHASDGINTEIKASSAHVLEIEQPWRMQAPSVTHTFHNHSEDSSFEASVRRETSGTTVDAYPDDLPANRIRVLSEVEVRRD